MSVRSAVHQTSVASKRKTSVLPNRRKKLSKMRSGKLRRFLIFVNDFDVCCVLCVVCACSTEPNRSVAYIMHASWLHGGVFREYGITLHSTLHTPHSTLCLPTCTGCKMLCILDDIPQNLPLSLISYISQ